MDVHMLLVCSEIYVDMDLLIHTPPYTNTYASLHDASASLYADMHGHVTICMGT
jgi:hypothetical protein